MSKATKSALAALAMLLAAATASATTHTVTNTADSGTGSLRQRIQIAAAGDTIEFAAGITNISVGNELVIGRDLVIRGPSARLLTLNGGSDQRIFNVVAGSVVLSGMHLVSGEARGLDGAPGDGGEPGRGGCILNAAVLTLRGIEFRNGEAIGGNATSSHALGGEGGAGEGGAIYNSGTLVLIDCTIWDCEARGGSGAGTFGRTNGGLARGGAIYNAGTASLTNCTLYSNNARGGASPSSVSGDGRGGALFGSATLNHCTLTSNLASGDAGSTTDGDGEGGALNGAITLRSTIVALNNVGGATATGPDAIGTLTSQGHNLIGKVDGSAGWVASDQIGTVAAPLDPNLGTLSTISGGPTQTRRPLPGSAAIDRGGPGGLGTDQTGHSRLYDHPAIANASGGNGSDVGAVETQPPVAWIVTHLGDVGPGSLRHAIEAVTTGDSIRFQPGLSGTVLLSYGQLYISRSCVIEGPGADRLTVRGSGSSIVLNLGVSCTVAGLTLTGAEASGTGCVFSAGDGAVIDRCAIVDNPTVGIYAVRSLTVRNSTIAGNVSTNSAGGIRAQDALTLENCTISGNSGSEAGGVLLGASEVPFSIAHCTISNNHHTGSSFGAGGVYSSPGVTQPPSVGGTVIAGNTSNLSSQRDVRGTFASQGYNLIGVNGVAVGFTAVGDQIGSAASPLNPMLGPLADNGGPTPTMLPQSGSPLIDRGITLGLAADQRGMARPHEEPGVPNAPGGDGSDIGATEWLPALLDAELLAAPLGFGIVAAGPIPFRSGVALAISLPSRQHVELDIYSVDGRRLQSVARGGFDAGTHRITWDGRDQDGREAPAGVYFARLRTPQGASTRRLVRIR